MIQIQFRKLHTNDSQDSIDGGVSQVSVVRVVKVPTGVDGAEVYHVGGDQEGGKDVTKDEAADNCQQCVHAVLELLNEKSIFQF